MAPKAMVDATLLIEAGSWMLRSFGRDETATMDSMGGGGGGAGGGEDAGSDGEAGGGTGAGSEDDAGSANDAGAGEDGVGARSDDDTATAAAIRSDFKKIMMIVQVPHESGLLNLYRSCSKDRYTVPQLGGSKGWLENERQHTRAERR